LIASYPVSNSSYTALEQRFAKLARLQDIAAMLQWDSAAMMPSGGAEARAEQLALRNGVA
jgi:carboxypeptidase Taq